MTQYATRIQHWRCSAAIVLAATFFGCAENKQSRQNTLLHPMQEPNKTAATDSTKVWPDEAKFGDPTARGLLAKNNIDPNAKAEKSDPKKSWAADPKDGAASVRTPGNLASDQTNPAKKTMEQSPTPIDTSVQQASKTVSVTAEQVAQIRSVIDNSLKFYEKNPNFTCRVTRQEKVNGKVEQPEIMTENFRTKPMSVYYKWLDDRNIGRECVYCEGQNEGKISTIGGKSDFPFRGSIMSVTPDGVLARRNSRYSITESSPAKMLRKAIPTLEKLADGNRMNGTFENRGTLRLPEYDKPVLWLRQVMTDVADRAFPKGGTRDWFFDAESYRMVVLKSTNQLGEFEEYYLFDQFVGNPSLSDDDFTPQKLWPAKFKGESKSKRRKNADAKEKVSN